MKKISFLVTDKESAYRVGKQISAINETYPVVVTVEKETRTTQMNKAQWPILNAIADQVQWQVNGAMTYISGDEFKQILTAAYRNETVRLAQGLDGGVVLLGHRTREFKRDEWPEWLEYLNWFAAEKGVKIPISKSQAKSLGFD